MTKDNPNIKARGPAVELGVDSRSTPLATIASQNLLDQLPKLGKEKAGRMHDFLDRKREPT